MNREEILDEAIEVVRSTKPESLSEEVLWSRHWLRAIERAAERLEELKREGTVERSIEDFTDRYDDDLRGLS